MWWCLYLKLSTGIGLQKQHSNGSCRHVYLTRQKYLQVLRQKCEQFVVYLVVFITAVVCGQIMMCLLCLYLALFVSLMYVEYMFKYRVS